MSLLSTPESIVGIIKRKKSSGPFYSPLDDDFKGTCRAVVTFRPSFGGFAAEFEKRMIRDGHRVEMGNVMLTDDKHCPDQTSKPHYFIFNVLQNCLYIFLCA